MSKEAMKLALGKIKSARDCHANAVDTLLFEAEEVLEEALAEQPAQQQEPVALGYMNAGHVHEMQQGRLPYGYVYPKGGAGANVAIYTSLPAQRTWVGLTDEERDA